MEEIKLVGDLNNFDTTIVGSFKTELKKIINDLESKGFLVITKESIIDLNVKTEEIEKRLNINNLNLIKLQKLIIAKIFELVDKGINKIVISELLSFIDLNVRIALIKNLKNNNVRFINITGEMEDAMLTDYLVILYDGKVALEGNTLDVLKEERLLSRMGFNMPFIVDISTQLKYYGLVDKVYLNKEELVNILWK